MRFSNEAFAFLLLMFLVVAATRPVAALSRHCLFSLTTGTSLEFTASAGGRGLVLLQSFHASNVLECKTECCANARCNVAVFQRIRSELVGEATNCFTAHCNTAIGCQSTRKTEYYLYSTSDAFILPPITTTPTLQRSAAATTAPAILAGITHQEFSSLTTLLDSLSITNATDSVSQTNSTSSPYFIATANNTTPILERTTAGAFTESRPSTFNPPTFPVADAKSLNTVKTSLDTTTRSNVAGSLLPTDKHNGSISSFGFTDDPLISKTYRSDVQHAYGVLASIAVLGTLLLCATVFIMWKSHREVRYRQYKEIIFLMHDQDVLYA